MSRSTSTLYTEENMKVLRQECLATGEAIAVLAAKRGMKQSSVSRTMKKFGVSVPKIAEIQQFQQENGTPTPPPVAETPVQERETVKRKKSK